MDAFGIALKEIAERWQADRRFFRSAPKKKRPPPRKTGQILRVPHGGSGDRAIYGRIVHAPAKGQREPGLGICVVIVDRDVAKGDDLEEVVEARSRVIEASVGGCDDLVRTIRAIRGLDRFRPLA